MSFSCSWLRLREPADRLARAPELLQMLEGFSSRMDYADVVDLGCGTGSNLRGIYTVLPRRQNWVLVDHDSALLEVAAEELAAWADIAGSYAGALMLEKDGRAIRVQFQQADLMANPAPWGEARPDLVTASALFDLVSRKWLQKFIEGLSAQRIPLYASLIYDGRAAWQPAHPADAAMVAAFNRHQMTDKGFGPACGPMATDDLSRGLTAAGYCVETEQSPWMLDGGAKALADDLNHGWAQAVRETGAVSEDVIASWLKVRMRGEETLVGHNDLLALPMAQDD